MHTSPLLVLLCAAFPLICICIDTEPVRGFDTQEVHLHIRPLHPDDELNPEDAANDDEEPWMTVHLHLKPNVLTLQTEFDSPPCAMQPNSTARDLCQEQLAYLADVLRDIKMIQSEPQSANTPLDEQLSHLPQAVCLEGNAWMLFSECYCTKCNDDLRTIPDEEAWTAIWEQLTFCKLKPSQNDTEYCKLMLDYELTKIDSAFKDTWNQELMRERNEMKMKMKEEKEEKENISSTTSNKTYNASMSKGQVKQDGEEQDADGFGFLNDHPASPANMFSPRFIYVFTLIMGAIIALVSFFITFR